MASPAEALVRDVRAGEHEELPPEQFVVEDGFLRRIIRRRDGTEGATDFGPCEQTVDDPSALADARFLRAQVIPREETEVEVRVADLFSGCGALSLGAIEAARAIRAHGRVVLAADLERAPLEVLARSLNAEDAIRCVDLAKVLAGSHQAPPNAAERAFLRGVPRRLELVVAGPPCQGHSSLNNHTRHDDDRNDLYLRVVRFVELKRPRFCLIENVATVTRDARKSVDLAVKLLSDLGYVVDHSVVNLDRLGVPQLRRRHVLVASGPGEVTIDVKETVERYAVAQARTVRWAIGDLVGLAEPGPFDRPSRPTRLNKHRMRLLQRGGGLDLDNEHRPQCHRLPRIGEDGIPREHSYKSMYGRLAWDKPAQTITSGYGSMGQGRYVHPCRPRTITPHEAARLQMLPDFYDFSGVARRGEWARMIGNAAPMKLSYVFALEMFR